MFRDKLQNNASQRFTASKTIKCPSCDQSISLYAPGFSKVVICSSCAKMIDCSEEPYKSVENFPKDGKRTQVIALGQKGKLHGVIWEVVGYLERVDGTGMYFWSEYLLFNSGKGFRWLTEFDGHWNYVFTTKSKVEIDSDSKNRKIATYLKKTYYLFHSGTANVKHAVGEFYWQIDRRETVNVSDFVSPPEILSCEKTDSETIWSLGQYIESEEIKSVFQITKPMPLKSGVAPNQPSTVSDTASYALRCWGVFLALIFTIQLCFLVFSKNETVFSETFSYSSTDSEKLKVTKPFELKHGTTNLEILLNAPVENSWLEMQASLVNDDNGQTLEFEQGVEFYSGSDSDGPWVEGDRTNRLVLSSVPSGNYHLNFQISSGKTTDTFYTIIVKRGVHTWPNFFWCLFLISFFPILVWWRSRSFEMSRWSQSNFSPYYQHHEGYP